MNPMFVKARSRLLLGNPFLGTLCLRQKPVEWDQPTGAVDGKHLYYNPKWFEKWNTDYLTNRAFKNRDRTKNACQWNLEIEA